MARLRKKGTAWSVRLRFGEGQDSWFDLNVPAEQAEMAEDRRRRLQRLAQLLKAAGKIAKSREILTQAASERTERAFRNIEVAVEGFSPEAVAAEGRAPTFRQVAEDWTSGRLAERFPEAVPAKTEEGRESDRAMLRVFYPALGDLPLPAITEEDTDRARALIPASLHPETRANYLQKLHQIFGFAAGPMRLIERSPIRVVKRVRPKRTVFWFLYPDEDAKLLACTRIPLAYRILYGFLTRNGTRISETLRLTRDHLDLDRGKIHLEAEWTKTGNARFWDLSTDVRSALSTWLEIDDVKSSRVFHGERSPTLNRNTVLRRFQQDLEWAGIERPELRVSTPGSRRLRLHDLRASFVTLALRQGRPLPWIMDRSGHENIQTIEKYRRLVRHADEAGLPQWFSGLDQAIPELRFHQRRGPSVGQAYKNLGETRATPLLVEDRGEGSGDPETPLNSTVDPGAHEASGPSGPAEKRGVGQSSGPAPVSGPSVPSSTPDTTDPVEQALAFAVTEATKASRWDVVLAVTAELRERRLQRTAPQVTSLEQARAKREKGEGK